MQSKRAKTTSNRFNDENIVGGQANEGRTTRIPMTVIHPASGMMLVSDPAEPGNFDRSVAQPNAWAVDDEESPHFIILDDIDRPNDLPDDEAFGIEFKPAGIPGLFALTPKRLKKKETVDGTPVKRSWHGQDTPAIAGPARPKATSDQGNHQSACVGLIDFLYGPLTR